MSARTTEWSVASESASYLVDGQCSPHWTTMYVDRVASRADDLVWSWLVLGAQSQRVGEGFEATRVAARKAATRAAAAHVVTRPSLDKAPLDHERSADSGANR